MDIGGLLSGNARPFANVDNHLGHMQQGLTMNMQFNLGHDGGLGSHMHQYNLAQSARMNYPHMNQPQHQQMIHSNISPVSATSVNDLEPGSPKTKSEPAAKNFKCSFTECTKAFARRSDLARHGTAEHLN